MKSTLPRRNIKNVEYFIYNGMMISHGSVERIIKGFIAIHTRDEKGGFIVIS